MPVTITAAELDWCTATAEALVAGRDPLQEEGFPIVNRGILDWDPASSTAPEDRVEGTHPRNAKGFKVALPAAYRLSGWFRAKGTPANARAHLEAYVAGVILHELVHFHQEHDGDLPELSASPTSLEFLGYYEDPREREAHGAQIACHLRASGQPASDASVFATRVGARIAERLKPLAMTPQAERALSACATLLAEVADWINRLP